MLMYYFYVFTGVFELYVAAGFTNSIIVLHIPPHYNLTQVYGMPVQSTGFWYLVMSWQQMFYMFL